MRNFLWLVVLGMFLLFVQPVRAGSGPVGLDGHKHQLSLTGQPARIVDQIDDAFGLLVAHSASDLAAPQLLACRDTLWTVYEDYAFVDARGLPSLWYAQFQPISLPDLPGYGAWMGGPIGLYGQIDDLVCVQGVPRLLTADGQSHHVGYIYSLTLSFVAR